MKLVFKNGVHSYVAIISAVLLLLCIVDLPGEYFKVLRIAIFIAAITIALKCFNEKFVFFSFLLIAYIFNPIKPIFLYQKAIWIPIDILTAILFFLMAFTTQKKKKNYMPYKQQKNTKKPYGRDKKY